MPFVTCLRWLRNATPTSASTISPARIRWGRRSRMRMRLARLGGPGWFRWVILRQDATRDRPEVEADDDAVRELELDDVAVHRAHRADQAARGEHLVSRLHSRQELGLSHTRALARERDEDEVRREHEQEQEEIAEAHDDSPCRRSSAAST